MKVLLMSLLFIFLLTWSCGTNAQTIRDMNTSFTIHRGAKLLYFLENNSGEKNQFLIPLIETELKHLKDKRDSYKRNVFSNVQSLNLLRSGPKATGTLIEAIRIFNKNNVTLKSNSNLIKEEAAIAQSLREKDFFLKININVLNNLIEFQFVLFKVDRTLSKSNPYIELQTYRTTSVFIDPTSDNYKEKIKASLRQIVIEANESPIPTITYNGKQIADTLFIEPGHLTLVADAIDTDSPADQLTYKWKLSQPSSGWFAYHYGKQLDDNDINGALTLHLILTVSDGVNTIDKSIEIISKPKPFIGIQYPETPDVEFYNNIYHLYSYTKTFKFQDFSSSLIMVKEKRLRRPNQRLSDPNWISLIPEIRLLTTASKKEQINFSTVRLNKVDEDSITIFKEKIIPLLSSGRPRQLADEGYMFKIKLDTLKTYEPDSNYYPAYYIHSYSVYKNNGVSQKIETPAIKTFRITAGFHESKSSESFQIQFHKVSRLNPYFNETMMVGLSTFRRNQPSLNIFTLGVGVEYLVVPNLTFNGDFGWASPTVFDSSVGYTNSSSYYYKLGVSVGIINFKNKRKAYLTLTDLHRAGFQLTNDKYVVLASYNSRFGVGFIVSPIAYTNYQFEPITAGWFVTYYPKTDYFSSPNIEIGIKVNYHFSK